MKAMEPIPISAAREIAERYGYDQVVVLARRVGEDPEPHGERVTTYGRSPAHCSVAAAIGNFLKGEIMDWPDWRSEPEGFVQAPRVCTDRQRAEMTTLANAMLTSVGKIDVGLLYEAAILAFEGEIRATAPGRKS